MRFFLPLLCSLFLLSSCAHYTEQHPLDLSWSERQHMLSAMMNWQFRGHFAFKSPQHKLRANIFWQQNDKNYDISIFGPFGIDAVEILGRPGEVVFKDNHGKTYHASSPESLLEQQVGWSLPVSSLYYWVRGLPAPGSVTSVQYDVYHRIDVLQQDEWKIQFVQYTRSAAYELPQEIIFTHKKDYVHLIIEPTSWQVTH